MSGLAALETELPPGRIQSLIGEGRTAEVLRNLCLAVSRDNPAGWADVCARMTAMFGVEIDPPRRDHIRGVVEMSYFDKRQQTRLDLASAGRGQLQILLLLTYLYANPGSTLLLDEPDAHLEILRQRQTYNAINDVAAKTGSQIIAASHSEIIMDVAAQRDMVISFSGVPHRLDDRGTQLRKALRDIPFDHYYQAGVKKFVLYLEGESDLEFLRAFAKAAGHPLALMLEDMFVHFVANVPQRARLHFHGLKDAEPGLKGFALFDHLERAPESQPALGMAHWRKREIENYVCTREILLRYAFDPSGSAEDDLVQRAEGQGRRQAMEAAISRTEAALLDLNKGSPWEASFKVSDDFLAPLFANFYGNLKLSNTMLKTNFHRIAAVLHKDEVHPEVLAMLDAIFAQANQAG